MALSTPTRSTQNRAGHKRVNNRMRTFILLCLVVILAVALGTVGIWFGLTSGEYDRRMASMQSRVDSLESRIAVQSGALDENSKRMQEQDDTIKAQEGQLADKEKKIQEKDATISDLQRQLVIRKKTQTTARPTTVASAVKPPVGKVTGDKMIALTFDDGPGPYTAKLLDAMKERGVHATFFLVGNRVDSYKGVVRRMSEEGHAIGNHSQNHQNLRGMSVDQMQKDLETCAGQIKAITGFEPQVLRCPGGNGSNAVTAYAKAKGIPIAYWSVDTLDWKSRNVNSILSTAFQSGAYGVRDGAIVLMHDIYSTSVDAAIKMMDKLQSQGYKMVTLPEMIQAKQGSIVPGKTYYSG